MAQYSSRARRKAKLNAFFDWLDVNATGIAVMVLSLLALLLLLAPVFY